MGLRMIWRVEMFNQALPASKFHSLTNIQVLPGEISDLVMFFLSQMWNPTLIIPMSMSPVHFVRIRENKILVSWVYVPPNKSTYGCAG